MTLFDKMSYLETRLFTKMPLLTFLAENTTFRPLSEAPLFSPLFHVF